MLIDRHRSEKKALSIEQSAFFLPTGLKIYLPERNNLCTNIMSLLNTERFIISTVTLISFQPVLSDVISSTRRCQKIDSSFYSRPLQ